MPKRISLRINQFECHRRGNQKVANIGQDGGERSSIHSRQNDQESQKIYQGISGSRKEDKDERVTGTLTFVRPTGQEGPGFLFQTRLTWEKIVLVEPRMEPATSWRNKFSHQVIWSHMRKQHKRWGVTALRTIGFGEFFAETELELS